MSRAGAAAGSALAATAAATLDLHLALPIGCGLLAVALARTVFVDRENRRRRTRQTLRETAPLTMIAMLIAIALIVEYDLNLPKAIFAGLGVGWVAVLLLDLIGERILAVFGSSQVKLTDMALLRDTPADMVAHLHTLDQLTKDEEPHEPKAP